MRQENIYNNPSFIEDDGLPRVISTSAGTAYLKIPTDVIIIVLTV